MRLTADTNLLVRVVTEDDPDQARRAQAVLLRAEVVAMPTPMLCEFVWVLDRGYGIGAADIARSLQGLMSSRNVVVARPAVEAGLTMLAAGGDFADGVIAHEGAALGGETFVSFDRAAVARLRRVGRRVELA